MTSPPSTHVTRTKFAGLIGESEIRLGRGGRTVQYFITICHASFTSVDILTQFLIDMENQHQVNDILIESGTINRTFPDCTFEGFTPSSSQLQDVAGTLITSVTGTWFVQGTLQWYQLSYF